MHTKEFLIEEINRFYRETGNVPKKKEILKQVRAILVVGLYNIILVVGTLE
jgi:hypothetical protein